MFLCTEGVFNVAVFKTVFIYVVGSLILLCTDGVVNVAVFKMYLYM